MELTDVRDRRSREAARRQKELRDQITRELIRRAGNPKPPGLKASLLGSTALWRCL